MVTDPIGDMLTRIRNGLMAGFASVEIPKSRTKTRIAEILKATGYIEDFSMIDDRKQGLLKVYLKYTAPKRGAIAGLKRESKPGRRVYVSKDEIPRVCKGMGVAVLSTPKGVMADEEARKLGVGGELLLTIW
jgi:small subunit ribosomal protein S8